MLNFESLSYANLHLLAPCTFEHGFSTCDYTVGGIIMWRKYFEVRATVINGFLVLKVNYPSLGECFTYPVGNGDCTAVLDLLYADARESSSAFRFCTVESIGLQALQKHFGEAVHVRECREFADYIYPIDNFITYSGKHLHGARSNMNNFRSEHMRCEFVELSASTAPVCADYLKEIALPVDTPPIAVEELQRAIEVFENYTALKNTFSGGMLVEDGKLYGVTAGEIVGDMLYVHIEKAAHDARGAFQTLASEYARYAKIRGASRINREDDSGDEGLRKSKLSYCNSDLLMKYICTIDYLPAK